MICSLMRRPRRSRRKPKQVVILGANPDDPQLESAWSA